MKNEVDYLDICEYDISITLYGKRSIYFRVDSNYDINGEIGGEENGREL